MSDENINEIVQSAIQRGHDIGVAYGFESALLAVQALIYDELSYAQARDLSDKILALKPKAVQS